MVAVQVSPARKRLIVVALFLSTMCTMGDMVIVPITGIFYEVFSDVALVDFIISGPAFVGLFFCVLAGWLVDKIDKRIMMLVGFGIFTLSSILGAAVVEVHYVLVMRQLATGVGWGLTSTAAFAILADLYAGDEVGHGKVVGLYNSSMAIIGALLSISAGLLALNGWRVAFFTYLVAIPVLILLFICLPKLPPLQRTEQGAESAPAHWWLPLVPLVAKILIVGVCYYVNVYMIAVYVTDAGIGDEAFIGFLSSCGTVASAAGGLFFGWHFARRREAVSLPSFFIMGICFLLMAARPTIEVSIVCFALMGLSWSQFYCYFYGHCTDLVHESVHGRALGVVGAANGIAIFGCSYLLTGLEAVTGTQSCLEIWPWLGVAVLITAVAATIGYFVRKRMKADGSV